jgi:ceramide glucosyltransferase
VLLTYILATFTIISLVLTLWQWLVATSFPLHKRSGSTPFTPSVSILKPIKGVDSQTAECLRSWCAQDYSGMRQLLFGVASEDDPACPVVRALISEFPGLNAQLVVCPEQHGLNAKVSTLIQLERLITGEVVIISDADVYAPPELLREIVAPLQVGRVAPQSESHEATGFSEPATATVGLVNCFYRLTNMSTFGMRWEAFAINADFWSQVLQAQSLKRVDFAMGAVMALPVTVLREIGGFAPLADFLADDYQLGNRVARTGRLVFISPVVVECRSHTQLWGDVWTHQTRWARTIRVSQPIPYFLSKLSNATFWPLLWVALDPGPRSIGFGAFCLAVRMAQAFYCEARMTGRARLSSLWMALIKDLLQLGVWITAFTGNRINWRGRNFRVQSDGKLIEAR